MEWDVILYDSHNSFFKSPFGAAPTESSVRFRIAVHRNYKPREVTLRFWSGKDETLVKLSPTPAPVMTAHTPVAARQADASAHHTNGALPHLDAAFRKADASAHHTNGALPHLDAAFSSADVAIRRADSAVAYSSVNFFNYIVYETVYETGANPGLFWYYFKIVNMFGEEIYYGNNPEMLGGRGTDSSQPPWSYQLSVYDSAFHVPEWLRNGIIYQIFPDRFYQKRGEPLSQAEIERKRPDYIFHTDWNDMPIYEPDPRTGEIMNNDFFGGNLAGIASKLPYLKDLGVNIIYLNPIFEAYSNHRYDTGDYSKIDPLLGTNSDFASLCSQARRLGIRIILDGVFNHTGSDSLYFNKDGHYKSRGAYQSVKSRYYNWYEFDEFPDDYKSWWGIETLPQVNENDPGFTDYIVSGGYGIVKHWLWQGASGWRLDVVDELPGEFVKELRKHVKKTDAEAVIIGEVWEDASNKVSYGKQREYFFGAELDSVMNYVFKNALIAYMLGKTSAEHFDAVIWKLAENYPKECFYSAMNLIGGHDVPRILTLLSEPPDDLTRKQKAMHKPTILKQRLGIDRLKLVTLLQMTFPGAPSVYYGDEAGMTGFEDPFNRGAYPWNKINATIFDWYKRVIRLRNLYRVLRTGSFVTIYANESSYVYIRSIRGGADVFGSPAKDEFALIAINSGLKSAENIEIDLTEWNAPALYDALENVRLTKTGADGEDSDGGASDCADGGSGASDCADGGGGASDCADGGGGASEPCPVPDYTDGRLNLSIGPLGCRVLIYPLIQ